MEYLNVPPIYTIMYIVRVLSWTRFFMILINGKDYTTILELCLSYL